jgi:NAD(P)-dependent dehydrogenase (short-subunit alcohol dehydrogenase family)
MTARLRRDAVRAAGDDGGDPSAPLPATTGPRLRIERGRHAGVPRGAGTILLTGASAGVTGYPQSAPFAGGTFALHGLAQSLAREVHPHGLNVAHVVIDGAIRSGRRADPGGETLRDPDAIARAYLDPIRQHRSCWSRKIAVRPWVERF